jgi:hypothetical protein
MILSRQFSITSIFVFNRLSEKNAVMLPVARISPVGGAGVLMPSELTFGVLAVVVAPVGPEAPAGPVAPVGPVGEEPDTPVGPCVPW